jgi:hypothetical protein
MLGFLISAALAAAAAATHGSGASAQLNQLESPRVAQLTQRIEFGANGPNFPFKFSFLDPVRPFPTRTCRWSIGRLHLAFSEDGSILTTMWHHPTGASCEPLLVA